MTLLALRTEVLNHGFDPIIYSSRINQYINDAQELVCRRVMYYTDEGTSDFNTTAGTSNYALPSNFAKVRSIRDTSRYQEMIAVTLRDIDRSAQLTSAPIFYAFDGVTLHLYPTPDQVYPMELRYWSVPADLVNDTDTPTIPPAYHRMLWYWAVRECYAADDDVATAQYWETQFNTILAEFAADVKFPNDDMPTQASGMWEGGKTLSPRGWTIYGTDWGW
jgi:hypothetical protein